MAEFDVRVGPIAELSHARLREICELTSSIWPPKGEWPSLETLVERYVGDRTLSLRRAVMVFDKERLVGHAHVFDREIIAGSRPVNNLALGGVCVRPEYRGKGAGALAVRGAFELIDDGRFACSVFQTRVPGFYEKLGCREVGNVFVNLRSAEKPHERPWWDPHVMVYPADFGLGDGVIDLNGPAY